MQQRKRSVSLSDVVESKQEADTGKSSFTISINKLSALIEEDIDEVIAAAVALSLKYVSYLCHEGDASNSVAFNTQLFKHFFNTCQKEFVRGNAEEIARLDAADFKFSEETLAQDGNDLRRLGTIENLVLERQASVRADRFNETRCRALFSGVADSERLLRLATEGAYVPVGSDFVTNPVAEKPRNLQKKLGNCYSKHAYKLWLKKAVLIFREKDIVESEMEKLNKNPIHWCVKPLFPPGRMLGDLSNRSEGTSINCPESKLLVAELYGEMSYPDINEIVSTWLDFADSNGYALSEMRMWKDDIRSAFNQFNFQPSETYKLAFTFAEGLIMIMICGFFGWTGAPQVFANFSRGMLEVLRAAVLGCIFIFCDDFIGFGHHSQAQGDQQLAQNLIVQTFGDNAWAEEKCVTPCLQAEILGWWVDLAAATIRPSDKAIRKLTFTFFTINNEASHWSLQMCQVLASLSYRYSQGLMGMRPFVTPFYELCAGKQSVKWRKVSSKARFAVEMWRVAIIILFKNKESMSVSLRVLVRNSSGYVKLSSITDGSYLGAGAVVLDSHSPIVLSMLPSSIFTSYDFPFVSKLPKFQNHREFLGLIVAIMTLIWAKKVPPQGAVLHWVNDNTSALKWAEDNMCKGEASQIAFMLYSMLLVQFKVQVVQVQHTAGSSELMKPVDSLSRRSIPSVFNPSLQVNLNDSVSLRALMLLCDPSVTRNASEHHVAFVQVNTWLKAFVLECM